MTGWVDIDRGLFDDPLFPKEPMSEREAFIWLKANAAWQDTQHRVGSEVVDCPRGSIFITLREFQTTTSWGSDTKIRNFLLRLESAGLIKRTVHGKRNARKTQVTICNYGENTDGEREENAPKTHRERTKNAVKEQRNNKQPSEAKASSGKITDRDRGFDEFWEVWPDKRAKQKARTAWRKLSIENKRLAFSAVRDGWFNRWRDENPDANAIHASSFLNAKRWEDQPAKLKLKTISGGRNGKQSITERLFPSRPGVDLGQGGNPSQPLLPPDGERSCGDGGHGGLAQGSDGIFAGSNIYRM